MNSIQQFPYIPFVNERVEKLYIRFGVNPQQPLCKALCLGFADVTFYIILSVKIGELNFVSVDNHNILKAKSQCAFGDDASNASATSKIRVFRILSCSSSLI